MTHHDPGLGPYLTRLAAEYGPGYLNTDPLGEVRRFPGEDDREVAGFVASGLAFGRVASILAHLRDLWERLGQTPARTADRWKRRDERRLDGFLHRWVKSSDMAVVIETLGRARRRHGSLHRLFLSVHDPRTPDLSGTLTRFVTALREEVRLGPRSGPTPEHLLPRGVRTFFADPAKGGACKRLNLFLRWMIRPDDGLDLGLWTSVRTEQLVIPLDTHVSRISRYLGLTHRRTVDWKMAVEVTEKLRVLDPRDPVRFDFALSRLGILRDCPRRVDPHKCAGCTLVPVCTLGKGRTSRV